LVKEFTAHIGEHKNIRKYWVDASDELAQAGMTEAANIVWEASGELPHELDFACPYQVLPNSVNVRGWAWARKHYDLCFHCGSDMGNEDICTDGQHCYERHRQDREINRARAQGIPRGGPPPRPPTAEEERRTQLRFEDFERWKEQRKGDRTKVSAPGSLYRWIPASIPYDPKCTSPGEDVTPEQRRYLAEKQAANTSSPV